MIKSTINMLNNSGAEENLKSLLVEWANAGDEMVRAWNTEGLAQEERERINNEFHKAESSLYFVVNALLKPWSSLGTQEP